ncbi:hypothetical protein MRB53_041649 [Persea americana]|nr:hypothetical protein MRB53_041649 [Persea americana]
MTAAFGNVNEIWDPYVERRSTLHNHGPFTDIAVLPHFDDGSRLMVTSGRPPYSALSELRYGLELLVDTNLDLGEFADADACWRVRGSCRADPLNLLLSFAGRSVIIGDIQGQAEMLDELDESTVAYSPVMTAQDDSRDAMHLQVTTDCIRLFHMAQGTESASPQAFELLADFEVEGTSYACMDPSNLRVLTVSMGSSQSYCQLKALTSDLEGWLVSDVGLPLVTKASVCCITPSMCYADRVSQSLAAYAFAGTAIGCIVPHTNQYFRSSGLSLDRATIWRHGS